MYKWPEEIKFEVFPESKGLFTATSKEIPTMPIGASTPSEAEDKIKQEIYEQLELIRTSSSQERPRISFTHYDYPYEEHQRRREERERLGPEWKKMK